MNVNGGIDGRAFAKVKLKAPKPLPHVSRRALKRVKDWVSPPTHCHCCGGAGVELVSNSVIYGKEFGKWPYAYLCPHCRAYVALHPDTDLPMGFLADSFVRDARKAAKIPFFTLISIRWTTKQEVWDPKQERYRTAEFSDRNAAYKWLSEKTGIPRKLCHFAMFDEEQALLAMEACYNELFEG